MDTNMTDQSSPGRSQVGDVHARGPAEDNASPNKTAKKKQRPSEEPVDMDLEEKQGSVLRTPSNKRVTEPHLAFSPHLVEFSYNMKEKPSPFWREKYPTTKKHIRLQGHDSSNAEHRSIETRSKEITEILAKVKGESDTWEANTITPVALKKIIMDAYQQTSMRKFTETDKEDIQRHVVKLAKTNPEVLGPTHHREPEADRGTVKSGLVNNQWVAANMLMGNVWKWETGTTEPEESGVHRTVVPKAKSTQQAKQGKATRSLGQLKEAADQGQWNEVVHRTKHKRTAKNPHSKDRDEVFFDIKAPMVEADKADPFQAISRAGCKILKALVTSVTEADSRAQLRGMEEGDKQAPDLGPNKVITVSPSHTMFQIRRYMQDFYHQTTERDRQKGYCPARICIATVLDPDTLEERFKQANENRKEFGLYEIVRSPVQARTLVKVAWLQPALTACLNAEDLERCTREMMPADMQSLEFIIRNGKVKDKSHNPNMPREQMDASKIAFAPHIMCTKETREMLLEVLTNDVFAPGKPISQYPQCTPRAVIPTIHNLDTDAQLEGALSHEKMVARQIAYQNMTVSVESLGIGDLDSTLDEEDLSLRLALKSMENPKRQGRQLFRQVDTVPGKPGAVRLAYLHSDEVTVKTVVGALPLIWKTKWGDRASHWSTPEAKEAARNNYEFDAIKHCYVSATAKLVQDAEARLDDLPIEEEEQLEMLKVMAARGLDDAELPTQCVITNMRFLDEMATITDNNVGVVEGASQVGSEARTLVSATANSMGGSARLVKSKSDISAKTIGSKISQGSDRSAKTLKSKSAAS